ncbi:DinB family protein [Occultella kanbiaonis]|uniref:DinB family protein n=1 Tax=Occultella kanbiaonis TaxID=2675754 RepID=UPI0012B84B64|nr:DinB family protein [Occultella kanbiaonis]
MADVDEVKSALHDELRWAREAMVAKLEGLSEYDVRRPMTGTGTNLLGLIKHLSMGESKYLGEVFGRPFPEHLPWWDADAEPDADKWATAEESRAEIVQRYERVCAHADATIDSLELGSPGHVAWWPRPQVRLVNVVAHVLSETNRHAGHADILREQLDGVTGDAGARPSLQDAQRWRAHVATVEAAARKASSTAADGT